MRANDYIFHDGLPSPNGCWRRIVKMMPFHFVNDASPFWYKKNAYLTTDVIKWHRGGCLYSKHVMYIFTMVYQAQMSADDNLWNWCHQCFSVLNWQPRSDKPNDRGLTIDKYEASFYLNFWAKKILTWADKSKSFTWPMSFVNFKWPVWFINFSVLFQCHHSQLMLKEWIHTLQSSH